MILKTERVVDFARREFLSLDSTCVHCIIAIGFKKKSVKRGQKKRNLVIARKHLKGLDNMG